MASAVGLKPRALALWFALIEEHQQLPPRKICEVNAKGPHVAAAFLQRWPNASYVGLVFNKSSTPLALAHDGRARFIMGDRLRTVRAASDISDCDVLHVDTEDLKPSRARSPRNLLIDDLPNALQRARVRSNTLIVSGQDCELTRRSRHESELCVQQDSNCTASTRTHLIVGRS